VRVLLHLDNLRVGGAQHSTIDLAVALGRAGHEAALAAGPGPLEALADERGVRRIALPDAPHPSRAAVRALTAAVDEVRPDVVLSLGPLAVMEAVAGAGLARRVPVVAAYPSEHLPPDAPRSTPVVARRAGVLEAARRRNPLVADVPAAVDTTYNHPDVDGREFRRAHAPEGGSLVVLVSRLSFEQKAAGIHTTLAAAEVLAARRPLRLVVVGDGSLRSDVVAAAGPSVHLVGELLDPRPAYAAADVVLGLGTSVLRGMAHGRPSIALGGNGEAVIVESAAVPALVATGWLATGDPVTADGLADLIETLLEDPARAAGSGRDGREAVVAERDGDRVVEALVPVLAAASVPTRPVLALDVARSWTGWWVRRHGGRLWRRVRYRLRTIGPWSRSRGSITSS
jgi:glycosyltransferase involved in cell wall biosynthesis